MYLYHGTSFENAMSILAFREIKGKKAKSKHKNRYVSFSRSKLVARQFGEVVFRFPSIETATRIPYNDRGWYEQNHEIVEYVIKGTITEDVERFVNMKEEQEYIVRNRFRFSDRPSTIFIIHENMKEITEAKEELKEFALPEDTIIRSTRTYEDFLNWL